jgi:hypothetical protein
MFNTEGIFEKIQHLQASLDELSTRIMLLSENNQENFRMLEHRLFQKIDEIRLELKKET